MKLFFYQLMVQLVTFAFAYGFWFLLYALWKWIDPKFDIRTISSVMTALIFSMAYAKFRGQW